MSKALTDVRLADILPGSITWDETVKSCMTAVDPGQQAVSALIPLVLIYSRIDELPSEVIDTLAWQFHVDFYRPWLSLAARREVVKNALDWHRSKGTPGALVEMIEVLTGITVTVRERPYFLTDHSLTDQDTLGNPAQPCFLTDASLTDQDYLGSGLGGPFEFDVIIPAAEARGLKIGRSDFSNVTEAMRPARSLGTPRFHGFYTDSAWSLTDRDLL